MDLVEEWRLEAPAGERNWVRVFSTFEPSEENFVKELLRAHEIPSVTTGDARALWGGTGKERSPGLDGIGWLELYVPREQAEEAKGLIEALDWDEREEELS